MLRMAGKGGVAPSALPMATAASIAASVKLSKAVGIYLRLTGKGSVRTASARSQVKAATVFSNVS